MQHMQPYVPLTTRAYQAECRFSSLTGVVRRRSTVVALEDSKSSHNMSLELSP